MQTPHSLSISTTWKGAETTATEEVADEVVVEAVEAVEAVVSVEELALEVLVVEAVVVDAVVAENAEEEAHEGAAP